MSHTPTAFVVFGATGDLTQRKIFPSLYKLARQGLLPRDFLLFGVAREWMNDRTFRASIKKDIAAQEGKGLDKTALDQLASHASYMRADLHERAGFDELERRIGERERAVGRGILRLFYLALPPALFADVVGNVETCRLGKALCTRQSTRSRVIVEKPFGHDTRSAARLERLVGAAFREQQIFRIDHYLGKEAVQNILTFRRANPVFEAAWSTKQIASIHIEAAEALGLEGRGAYYDQAGAIRDMVQSHLLELLAFLTMDVSGRGALSEQERRARVLSRVRAYGGVPLLLRGQYAGYADEPGVTRGSRAETYASLAMEIASPRWRGVPVFIRTGKYLAQKKTAVAVTFKAPQGVSPNRLFFQLEPRPAITLSLNVVRPGFVPATDAAAMHYCRGERYVDPPVGDYERLLLAAIAGDRSLFVSAGEVRAAWHAVDPFLAASERSRPVAYARGADGPTRGRTSELGYPWPQSPDTCPFDRTQTARRH